jgi:L-threonylcarbamoyladenylate synthase
LIIPFRSDDDVTAALPRILEHLQSDGLIAYPTETVYGFGGIVSEAAAAKLQALKRREAHKPFLLLITDLAQVKGIEWPAAARELARRLWPGPLTLAVPADAATFPPGVVSPDGTVALRATPHEAMRRVIRALDAPLTSSSANAPGRPAARTAAEAAAALRTLGASDVLVLDGGELPVSAPSTVVTCRGNSVGIVRAGVVTREQLLEHLVGTGIDVE